MIDTETKRISDDELAYLRVRLSALNIAAEALQNAQAEYARRMADRDGFISYMSVKYGIQNPLIDLTTGAIAEREGT
jgi:hypothetical protein